MSFREALNYQLRNGTNTQPVTGARCWPAGNVRQSTRVADGAYLTYQIISNVQTHHQADNASLSRARVQINAYGVTPKIAEAARDAVKADLDTLRGAMGETGSTVTVRKAYLEADHDSFIPPIDASQRGPQFKIMDFVFWFVE